MNYYRRFYPPGEVIDLLNPELECSFKGGIDIQRRGATGVFLDGNYPLICGGWNTELRNVPEYDTFLKDCQVIGHSTHPMLIMGEKRHRASGVKLNETTFWVVGGYRRSSICCGFDGSVNSTEFINIQGKISTFF